MKRGIGFEVERRGSREGTGISGRERGFTETWRSRRHELGQGESTDSSQHMVPTTRRCRARVHPGLPRGRIVLQSPGEGKGDKGTAGNSWKQLEPRGGFGQCRPAPSCQLAAPRRGEPRGTRGDIGAGAAPGNVSGFYGILAGFWAESPVCPAAREGLHPTVRRRLRVGFAAGMDGVGLSPAVPRWGRPEATAAGEAQLCPGRAGELGRGKSPVPSRLASVLAARVAAGDCPWHSHGKVRARIKLFLEQSCPAPRSGGDCLL